MYFAIIYPTNGNCITDVVCYFNSFTSVQLTTTADESINGYMVASRQDTGTLLGADVATVGASWEMGTDMKLVCGGVSIHYT